MARGLRSPGLFGAGTRPDSSYYVLGMRKCTVKSCERKHHIKGLCSGHHTRLVRTGSEQPDVPFKIRGKVNKCSVPQCEYPSSCKGWCEAHYERFRRTGDVSATVPIQRKSRVVCVVSNCGRTGKRGGLCEPHSARKRKYGDILADIPIGRMQNGKLAASSPRDKRLRNVYGITEEDFLDMKKSQKGLCAVCKKSSKENGRELVVDHCHRSGRIRALLCDRCNTVLGLIEDKPDVGKALAKYLTKHEEK